MLGNGSRNKNGVRERLLNSEASVGNLGLRSRINRTLPRGFSEGGFGGALACGDDDDGGVDRRASGDGHARLSEPSLVSPEEAGRGVTNIKN